MPYRKISSAPKRRIRKVSYYRKKKTGYNAYTRFGPRTMQRKKRKYVTALVGPRARYTRGRGRKRCKCRCR